MIIDGNSKVGNAKVYETAREMELQQKVDKLKSLMNLTDKSVCCFKVGEIQIIQWIEFIKQFPEEGEVKEGSF